MGKKLTAGGKAPDFNLPDDSGAFRSLKSFVGAKLVVYFYPKDNTTGCTKEATDFEALKSAFEKAGTAIVGISPDPVANHAKFKAKHKLGLTLLSDESTATLNVYGVWAEKSMYGRTYMGVERTTFLIGADGTIAKIWPKVKVPGHAAEVLAAAQALR